MSTYTTTQAAPQTGITPRIIIHGGAGNITRTTISRARYDAYQNSLKRILVSSYALLRQPGATALDVATHAVSLLENDTLYNSAKGAVFTRAGTNELECSIMVSNGYRKRGVGCMLLSHVKNPIKLARELLVRGEDSDTKAKDHCQYSGEFVEDLAREWGLEMCEPGYYFTQEKWEQHKRGLKEEEEKASRRRNSSSMDDDVDGLSDWEKNNYVPLGTCGAVVLDSFGTICTATSTGGLTNKVPGRIGDTPTLGAGFWAEEWYEAPRVQMLYQQPAPPNASSPLNYISRGDLRGLINDCLPSMSGSAPAYESVPAVSPRAEEKKPSLVRHAVALSGTGNGDTFLRMAAARTVAAKSRFSSISLSSATTWMAGPDGELQKSAGDRWEHVHEGVGGIIGIELVGTKGTVVSDFNCGGMFRAWMEEDGSQKCLVFREDGWESGPKGWDDI